MESSSEKFRVLSSNASSIGEVFNPLEAIAGDSR